MPSGIYQSPNRCGGVKGRSGVYLKSKEHKEKIGVTLKLKIAHGLVKPNTTAMSTYWLGKKRTFKNPEERIRKIKLKSNPLKGELHPKWIKDRTKLKRQDRRGDPLYCEWRRQVYKRDDWKCKIANQDCSGRIEAHHILPWKDYPELRYIINNGIALCHFHHPRTRDGEVKLIQTFTGLVMQKN